MTVTASLPPSSAIAVSQLRALNHRFVSALATGDASSVAEFTDDDFLMMGVTGDWLDREQFLALMRKHAYAKVSYDDVRVRMFGEVALLHGVYEWLGDSDLAEQVRYTHVYRWRGAGWRLIHAQNTQLKTGAAIQQHQGRAPVLMSWQGIDPVGEDKDVLHDLNAAYVQAFRDADVVWYDAHLSHDYVVISSDGSFHDRAKALNDFAKPVFAQHMRSFPVAQVRIRSHGSIALIDAENAYERKDGLRGINRYTDIWSQQIDGRWLCIAAHITTHQAPK
jgi:uncharacterized protein (TIGR02246 family)